jgi:hypothetical protein
MTVAALLLVIAVLIGIGIVLASAILQRLRSTEGSSGRQGGEREFSLIARPLVTRPSTPYSALTTYLDRRYASHVVLTFEQIESLLGFSLPAPASTEREWWTNPNEEIDGHTVAWTGVGRTATPNLFARTVAFNRST